MMKAIVLEKFGGPENLHWKDWPLPTVKAGEVRIRIRAVSVNPVDYKMRKGLLAIPLPDVLGRDVAGTVDAVGAGVTEFQLGDEVFAVLFGPRSNGAYAQYVSTPAAFVSPKPRALSYAQAACLGVAGMTAYDAVMNKAKVRAGEAVLVAGGAGGVGSFAIPLIQHCGADKIIATAGSKESAHHLVNRMDIDPDDLLYYNELDSEEMHARVRKLTNERGVAVAFDFVGGNMKRLCFNATGFDGRVVSTVEEPAAFDLNIWRADSPLFAKSGTYHFVALSARARNGGPDAWSVYREMMSALTDLIESGQVKVPKATELGALSEETLREAHSFLESAHVKGKLVLSVA
ncbi:MAG: zinc-binding dehydrogenase [Desulfobacterales bacterium]|nr:MAG: zinc-binding dehydrogenase [Desulfobacterales bacterium]